MPRWQLSNLWRKRSAPIAEPVPPPPPQENEFIPRNRRRFAKYRDPVLPPSPVNTDNNINPDSTSQCGSLTDSDGSVLSAQGHQADLPFNPNRVLGVSDCDEQLTPPPPPSNQGSGRPSAPPLSETEEIVHTGVHIDPRVQVRSETPTSLNIRRNPRRRLFSGPFQSPIFKRHRNTMPNRNNPTSLFQFPLLNPVANPLFPLINQGPQPAPAPAPAPQAQPARMASVNMEMPKYTHQLSKLALRLFIQRFQRWAEAKEMSVSQAKLALPLAFINPTAQNYFMIHFHEQDDDRIGWIDYINNFMNNCPMEVDDPTSILEILARKQPEHEKASVFIQRIRALISEEYSKYAEPDVIRLMMDGLNHTLRQYLECRGPPQSYNEIIQMVKHYEARGLDHTLVPPPAQQYIPAPPLPQAFAPIPAQPLQSAPVAPITAPAVESVSINYASATDLKSVSDQIAALNTEILKLTFRPDNPPNNNKDGSNNTSNNGQDQQGGNRRRNGRGRRRGRGGRGNGRGYGARGYYRDDGRQNYYRRDDYAPRDNYRRDNYVPRDNYRGEDYAPRGNYRRDDYDRDEFYEQDRSYRNDDQNRTRSRGARQDRQIRPRQHDSGNEEDRAD